MRSRTSLNSVEADNAQANIRVGLTLELSVDRSNSLKLDTSTKHQREPAANSARLE